MPAATQMRHSKAQKEGMPEDESKDGETQAQKLLEKFTKTLDGAPKEGEGDQTV